MERSQSQKEEKMLEQIQATVRKGKTKIEERFEELIKELTEGLEREKTLMEVQYVSPCRKAEVDVKTDDFFLFLARMSFTKW